MKEIQWIAEAISDKKGFNIIALDVTGISPMCDYLVIAEGNVDRHTRALMSAVSDKAKGNSSEVYHTEGEDTGDWIVMDLGNVMVHLFVPELREKYALEELWHEGKIVNLGLKMEEMR